MESNFECKQIRVKYVLKYTMHCSGNTTVSNTIPTVVKVIIFTKTEIISILELEFWHNY